MKVKKLKFNDSKKTIFKFVIQYEIVSTASLLISFELND